MAAPIRASVVTVIAPRDLERLSKRKSVTRFALVIRVVSTKGVVRVESPGQKIAPGSMRSRDNADSASVTLPVEFTVGLDRTRQGRFRLKRK